MDVVRAIRNARSEYGSEAAKRIAAILAAGQHTTLLDSQRAVISSLARLDDSQLQIVEQSTQVPPQAVVVHVRGVTIYLPLAGMLDLEKEKARVTGEIELVRAQIARSEQLLASEFSTKAPAPVVAKERERLASSHERVGQLETRLAQLSGRPVEPEAVSARAPKKRIAKQVKRKLPSGKKPGKKHQPVKTKPRKGQRKK